MTSKVVEFKKKEQKEVFPVEEMKQKIKKEFLDAIDRKEEEVMSPDELHNTILNFIEEGNEFVFKDEASALIFATALLEYPEFENVSYFNIIPNISRKSTFFSLKPVYKSPISRVVFVTDEMLYSANLININNIKDSGVQE